MFFRIIFLYTIIILIHQKEYAMDLISEECNLKSEWGFWRCPGVGRKCSSQFASRYKCIGGDCTIDSPCARLEKHNQTDSCTKILQLGECVPWWVNWSPWSKCTATCGSTEKHRFRACVGAFTRHSHKQEIQESISKSCSSIKRAHDSVETVPCPISRLCPIVGGGWGDWSEFSACSVTCGVGKRIRRRQCNRPRPEGGGLYCQGSDFQEVISNVTCEGYVPCPQTGQWCPWSPVVQQCTHNCGLHGMGLRLRRCACPKPSHGGSDCKIPPEAAEIANYERAKASSNSPDAPKGFEIETIAKGEGLWVPCNRHHCPYLRTLDVNEEPLISQDLILQKPEDTWIWSGGIPQKLNGPVHLFCPRSHTSRKEVFDKPERFPKSKSYWTRSIPTSSKESYDNPGEPVENTKLILVEGDHLTIRKLEPSTMGIYRFGYEYEPGYFETVCFFPVYIQNWQQTLPHGITFDLVCNSLGLWPIISKPTTGRWYTYWNVTLIKEMKDIEKQNLWWYTELKMPDITQKGESIPDTNETSNISTYGTGLTVWDTEYRRIYDTVETMTGYYECQVYNQVNATYSRIFTTQSLYLVIKPAPDLWTLVKEWCIQHKVGLIVIFTVAIISSIAYGICLWIKARKLARLELQVKEARNERQIRKLHEIDASTK
ncbi:unnamed protein product [Heterobilharzia americana]|nr:unnamed protein product [Heterobilharzia americana]